MLKKLLSGASVGIALLATTISGAKADTVSVGFSTSLNGPVTLLNSGTGIAGFTGLLGATGFSTNSGGTASPILNLPALLDTNSITASSATSGEIFIWITDSGISNPLTGTLPFASTLTSNTLTGNVLSLTLQTYLDAADKVFNTTPLSGQTLLASQSFTSTGTANDQTNVLLSGLPYSVTGVYDVVLGNGGGSVNATINVAVPGPIVGAGLPGLLAACGGLVAFARRRRRQAA